MNNVDTVLQGQVASYTAWVNSQLKKLSEVCLIQDLKHDMRNGIAFPNIIKILCQWIYDVYNRYMMSALCSGLCPCHTDCVVSFVMYILSIEP